ncbi:hypothetical protein D3C81_2066600 [compost metagenome]
MAGQQAHRLQGAGIRLAVARGEVLVPELHLEPGRQGDAEEVGGALQQAFHLGPLGGVRARDGHAHHAGARQRMFQRQGEAGVGAGAA